MAIHTFGDYCRWHLHVHAIVADGLFYGNGTFYVMPRHVDFQALTAIFRANVLQMLKREAKINDTKTARWKQSDKYIMNPEILANPIVFRPPISMGTRIYLDRTIFNR